MFNHNFKYEWIQLVRDRWVITLLIIFVTLSLFASLNGKRKVDIRQHEITQSLNLMKEGDEGHKAMIDSVNMGLKKDLRPWLNPTSLSFVGNRAPRVVAMQPAPLAFVSTGQSDLYSHTVKPTLYGEAYLLSFSELSNPVQLLFGTFDLSFVCIYLLPLLVLAFSYNLLSAEKEQGSLRLTMAQPVSLYRWLLGKMLLRFLIMTGIVWVSLLLSIALAGISMIQQASEIFQLLLITAGYILFWFVVAMIINAKGSSSGANAVSMISVWVVLVLLLPAVIAQLADNLHPVPSRINMIHEMRMAQADAEKKADEILDGFLRDHPELVQRDTLTKNQYEFYLKYFASQDIVRKAVRPVLDEYQSKLKAQQEWVYKLRFLSPSLVLQNSLNKLSGTSTEHYNAYRDGVISFAESWRNYFMPRMFRNENMSKADFDSLPSFQYKYTDVPSSFGTDFLFMTVIVVFLLGLSIWMYREDKQEQIISA